MIPNNHISVSESSSKRAESQVKDTSIYQYVKRSFCRRQTANVSQENAMYATISSQKYNYVSQISTHKGVRDRVGQHLFFPLLLTSSGLNQCRPDFFQSFPSEQEQAGISVGQTLLSCSFSFSSWNNVGQPCSTQLANQAVQVHSHKNSRNQCRPAFSENSSTHKSSHKNRCRPTSFLENSFFSWGDGIDVGHTHSVLPPTRKQGGINVGHTFLPCFFSEVQA